MLQSGISLNGTMADPSVLVVAGTHGNEVNAPWLLEQWQQERSLLQTSDLNVHAVIGNPEARQAGRRYIDRDLNRSFRADLLARQGEDMGPLEVDRARALLAAHGPEGRLPCSVALDLHSTTAAMGSCLVVYGRRPADLALAALVQGALGLPIYLHEADAAQTGFLVESWPCGLVIEVGPVPQGVFDARIVRQTRLALETCFTSLAAVVSGRFRFPHQLVVHRHLNSVDLPRDPDDQPSALLHDELHGSDWSPLDPGQPMFDAWPLGSSGGAKGPSLEGQIPVFINEAAYVEKRIALSLTQREVWSVEPGWGLALQNLLKD